MIKICQVNKSNHSQMSDYLQLLEDYALDPSAGGQTLKTRVKQNLLAEIQHRDFITLFLAYKDNKAIGLITLMEGFSTFQCQPLINIHDVYVAPENRGQGISSQLLNAAQQFAIQKLCCKLTLEVLDGNTIAKHAYQNFGFKAVKFAPQFGTAVFWEKKINIK